MKFLERKLNTLQTEAFTNEPQGGGNGEVNDQLLEELEEERESHNRTKMRVGVLEEALAIKANELNVAGHADLLANMSRLKGEVKALKEELEGQDNRVRDMEREEEDLSSQNRELLARLESSRKDNKIPSSLDFSHNHHRHIPPSFTQDRGEVERERDSMAKIVEQTMERANHLSKVSYYVKVDCSLMILGKS